MQVEDDPVVSRKLTKKKKEEPEYKQSFLALFLEDAEHKITHEEQQKAMREKLARFNKDHAGSGGKTMPKSILKKPNVDTAAIKMPAHLSKAHRAPVQIEDQ